MASVAPEGVECPQGYRSLNRKTCLAPKIAPFRSYRSKWSDRVLVERRTPQFICLNSTFSIVLGLSLPEFTCETDIHCQQQQPESWFNHQESFYFHPSHPYLFVLNTGCCSIVCEMKLRSADHRLAVGFDSVLASPLLAAGADVMLDISVRFLLKRSRSNLSIFSRRFRAPGLCLRVFCLMTFT